MNGDTAAKGGYCGQEDFFWQAQCCGPEQVWTLLGPSAQKVSNEFRLMWAVRAARHSFLIFCRRSLSSLTHFVIATCSKPLCTVALLRLSNVFSSSL